jgi:hypothetical protein
MGLTDQVDRVANAAPSSIQEIADLPSSVSGPIFQPMEMVYTHDGTRVYYTTYTGNASDFNEASQLAICGIYSSAPAGGAGGLVNTVGQLFADWEIDFYRPMYPQNELSARPPVGDVKDCKNASAYAVHDSDVKDSKATHQQKDPPPTGAAAAAAVAKPALVRSTSRESLVDSSALEKPTYFMMVPPTVKKKL